MTRCVYTAHKASPTIFAVYTTPSQTIENCCRAFVPAFVGDRTRAYRVGCHRSRINHRFLTDFPWLAELPRWSARLRSWSSQLAGFSGDSAVVSSGYAAVDWHACGKNHDALNFTLICLIVKSIFENPSHIPARFSPTVVHFRSRQTTGKKKREFFHENHSFQILGKEEKCGFFSACSKWGKLVKRNYSSRALRSGSWGWFQGRACQGIVEWTFDTIHRQT